MKFNKAFFLFFLFFGLFSCSTQEKNSQAPQLIPLEGVYLSSGTEQFFLPSIPQWANYSLTGRCLRKYNPRMVNLETLRGHYNLSYKDGIHFQYILNKEIFKAQTIYKTEIFTQKEMEGLFYNALEKVKAKLYELNLPTYQRVHIVWIDPFIGEGGLGVEKLKEKMEGDIINLGHPVFFSLCLNYYELKNFIDENDFWGIDIKGLSFETLTPYNHQNEKSGPNSLEIHRLFDKKQKIYFYGTTYGKIPEVRGQYIYKKF